MRKNKFIVLLTMSFLSLATACTKTPSVPGKEIIKFFGWGSTAEKDIFQEMIIEFQNLYPQYSVSYSSTSSENFMTSLAGLIQNPRQAPDVFYMPDLSFVEWINDSRKNVMMDLTDYIKSSDVFSLDNVYSQGISAYQFDPASKKLGVGGIYGLPKDLGPNMLAYNKTMVQENGISIVHDKDGQFGYNPETKVLNDKVAMTWAQFVAFCKDNSKGELDKSNSIVGITHYPLEAAYLSNGGSFLDTTNKKVAINNAKFAESLQFVADLSNKYKVMTTAEGQATQAGIQRFTSGLAATCFVQAWNTPTLWNASFDWDILYTPVPNESGELEPATEAWKEGYRSGCSSKSILGSVALSVYKRTSVPEGAYKLVEFLTMHPIAQRINYKRGQAVPNLIDMTEGEFLTAQLSDPKTEWNRPQNREVYSHMLVNSPRRPQAYTYNAEWWDEMWDSTNNTFNLYRVWNPNTTATYGAHIDVFDWNVHQMIDNGFLKGLEDACQAKLAPTISKYSW